MPKNRKPSTLKPLKTMRIFCEGAKTEPAYIKAYLASFSRDGRRSVIEVEKTDKNTAVQLVEEAAKVKTSGNSLPDDEVWVVYDRESVAKYSETMHAKAVKAADKSGVNVAITNVCFEYWILLHLIDTSAPYGSYSDLMKSSNFKAEFRKLTGTDYDKAAKTVFSVTKSKLTVARSRAAKLNAAGVAAAPAGANKPFQINPYVGVVELLDAIDQFT